MQGKSFAPEKRKWLNTFLVRDAPKPVELVLELRTGQEAGDGSGETLGGMELAHLHSTAKLAYSELASFSRITLQCALTEPALSVHISCRAPFVFRRLTARAPLVGCVFMCSLHVMCDTYYNRQCTELNALALRLVDIESYKIFKQQFRENNGALTSKPNALNHDFR